MREGDIKPPIHSPVGGVTKILDSFCWRRRNQERRKEEEKVKERA
jgi:hypothetical protein